MRFIISFLFMVLLICVNRVVLAQDYGEWARGHGMARRNNRGPMVAGGIGALAGIVAGGWFSKRRLKVQWDKEKKEILTYVSAQDEIYRKGIAQWDLEYKKLYKAYQQLEKETLERDYEEFKAPDVNGDDMISRSEFTTYVRKYLSSFPELSEKDFPRFDEFDMDTDGIVSFDEWQRYLQLQKQKEAKEAAASGTGTGAAGGGDKRNDLLSSLYDDEDEPVLPSGKGKGSHRRIGQQA